MEERPRVSCRFPKALPHDPLPPEVVEVRDIIDSKGVDLQNPKDPGFRADTAFDLQSAGVPPGSIQRILGGLL